MRQSHPSQAEMGMLVCWAEGTAMPKAQKVLAFLRSANLALRRKEADSQLEPDTLNLA